MDGCQHLTNAAPCDDGNVCTVGDQCAEGGCQPGSVVSETCDMPDLDHDGVCPYDDCAVVAEDLCPTVWNPDNSTKVCAPYEGGFAVELPVALTEHEGEDGRSSWRRTHEPFDLPLQNGVPEGFLLGYWPLANGEALDLSEGGHHGQVQGSLPYAGKVGEPASGLMFNGQTYYVQLAGSDGVNDGTPLEMLTVGMWAQIIAQTGSTQTLWFDGSQTSATWLYYDNDGSVNFRLVTDSGDVTVNCGEAMPGQWFYVAGTWDGERVACYVDGALGGTAPAASMQTGNDNTRLGYAGGTPLWGALDDVFLLSRAMDADEVRAIALLALPLGSSAVPGVQPDLDDLRVVEASYPSLGEYQVPFEVVGAKPHSDSACSAGYEEWPVGDIPYIADRDNLCGVLAYWPMDGDADDVLGLHDGANTGGTPTFGRFGGAQGALEFDGEGDYVDTGLVLTLEPTDSLTIEAWVRSTVKPLDPVRIFGFSQEDNGELWVEASWDGAKDHVAFRLSDDEGAVTEDTVNGTNLTDGDWHHVALVRNVALEQLCLYLDGLPASCVGDMSHDTINFDALSLHVGAQHSAEEPMYFQGLIDDVLVHEVAKSAEYIFRRARPSVPTARFFVSTQAEEHKKDGFEWYAYKLIWGTAGASALLPRMRSKDGLECYGLLSPCIGYGGWWRLAQGSGVVAVDSSTGKNHGALLPSDGPPAWGLGMVGAGLAFDGLDDMVQVPSAPGLEPADEFTLEAGVAVTGHEAAAHTIASRPLCHEQNEQEGTDEYSLFLAVAAEEEGASEWAPSALVAEVSTSDGAGQASSTDENVVFEDDEWALIAAVYDGSSMVLTVDDESWETALTGAISYDDHDLFFGSAPLACDDGSQFPLKGRLDFVRVMSRALATDERLHFPMADLALGDQTGCTPDCFGRECGPDGCDGECGDCSKGNQVCNQYGLCECASDSIECGDACCESGNVCYQGLCCEPQCGDCGNDECGGICGSCEDGHSCTIDTCVDDFSCGYKVKDGFCLWGGDYPSGCVTAGINHCSWCDPAWPYVRNNSELNGQALCANPEHVCCNGQCKYGTCP